MGRRKGKLTVEFATLDDLRRVVAIMVPSDADPAAMLGSAGQDQTG
jgi:hypothetical protein